MTLPLCLLHIVDWNDCYDDGGSCNSVSERLFSSAKKKKNGNQENLDMLEHTACQLIAVVNVKDWPVFFSIQVNEG